MAVQARNLYLLRLLVVFLLALGLIIVWWRSVGHFVVQVLPEYSNGAAPAARFDGTFPCVSATVHPGGVFPQLGKCAMPTTHEGVVDRFEADLRSAEFVLQETDLRIKDVFDVPLTRSYRSWDWVHPNRIHAFGRNSNHPYDIAPLGTRNPYTYQMLVLEDGECTCARW